MSQENVEIVREVYARWTQGDIGAALDVFDENLTCTTFAAGEGELVHHGIEALVAWSREFFSHWRNYRIEANKVIDRGDKVLVIGHQYAEGKGSGVPMDMPLWTVWTFRDSRVTELLVTGHRAKALEAVGLRE
jgi:ketosteroid isomerase-like protein